MYEYTAKVVSVYDGGTVEVLIKLGFGISHKISVKLANIKSPGLGGDERPFGLLARDNLRELILDNDIIIKTYKGKYNQFDVYYADIYHKSEQGLYCVNDFLVENKFAVYKEY